MAPEHGQFDGALGSRTQGGMRTEGGENTPADQLVRLASLVGAYLSGQRVAPVRLDRGFVHFAAVRHRMGPLLLAAAGDYLDRESHARLEEGCNVLKQRQALEELFLKGLDARFSQAAIPWVVLKGVPQARILYGDPSLRSSADLDILVPPDKFGIAVEQLRDLGWITGRGEQHKTILHSVAFRVLRDIVLRLPGDPPFHIELHQRPLFSEPYAATGAALMAVAERNPFPAPAFGPTMAYYSFLHGAFSCWCRLKWLTDFAQVLVKLDATGSQAVALRAEQQGTRLALAASVLLTTELYPHAASSHLHQWADEHAKQAAVLKRRDLFWSALASQNMAATSPFFSRRQRLRVEFLVHESLSARLRLLLIAPTSLLIRQLSGFAYS